MLRSDQGPSGDESRRLTLFLGGGCDLLFCLNQINRQISQSVVHISKTGGRAVIICLAFATSGLSSSIDIRFLESNNVVT